MEKQIFVLVILISLLTACKPNAEEQAAMTAKVQTATAAAWSSTPAITNTPTPTSTATHTPNPTETFTPTPSDNPTATKTQRPTYTPDLNRYYAPDNTFSFVAPEGWEPEDIGTAYPALVRPNVGDFAVNIQFFQEESTLHVFSYSAFVQDAVEALSKNLTQISEDFLVTDEGKDYFRWEFTDVEQGVT